MAKILIVDDDKRTREAAQEFLGRHFPYDQFLTAGTYHEALQVMDAEPKLDGIISDFSFPGKHRDFGGADLYFHALCMEIPFAFFSGTPAEQINDVISDRFPDEDNSGLTILKKPGIEFLPAAVETFRKSHPAKRPAATAPASKHTKDVG